MSRAILTGRVFGGKGPKGVYLRFKGFRGLWYNPGFGLSEGRDLWCRV
jgi:hypothetical protein